MQTLTERTVGTTRLVAVQGDITTADVDVIVNAANEYLVHGGGVASAISRAGGPDVQRESSAWVAKHGPLLPGRVAVTSAGEMPSGHILHVVGPRFVEGEDNARPLAEAVMAALQTAAGRGAKSIAIPAISAGIFGYPANDATEVIASTVAAWASSKPLPSLVLLVGYDRAMAARFALALDSLAD